MIERKLRAVWVQATIDVLNSDPERYVHKVKPIDVKEFLRDHIDILSEVPINFRNIDDDFVIDVYEAKLDAHGVSNSLKQLTREQVIAEALKISFSMGLRPAVEIELGRSSKPNQTPSNIDLNLKKTWSQAARGEALNALGAIATPAAGSFSSYLGRLFKRETLQHVTNESFIANLDLVYDEIQKDIDANKSSTGRVAKYTMKAMRQMVDNKMGCDHPKVPQVTTPLKIKR